MSPTTTRQTEPDQACADAVDLARAAAEEDAGPGQVGAHVGIEADADRVVTHLFACLSPAYVGWRWAVTVSRAARARAVTVSESVLLPGPDSMLAPPWVPWTERVRPGDLKAGDLMPAGPEDERLVPVVAIAGDAGLLDWDEGDAWRLGAGAGAAGPAGEGADLAAEGAGQAAGTAAAGPGEAGTVTEPGAATEPGTGTEPGAPSQAGTAAEPVAGSEAPEAGGETGTPGAPAAVPAEAAPLAAGRAAPKSEPGGRGRGRRRPARGRAESVGMLRPTRVLSATGRDDAAARWYAGEQGPKSALAGAAPANCMTCGFMVRLSGPLGRVFGVCANEFAPDDGKVVSVDHGCGAHSEGEVGALAPAADAAPTVDELGYDMITTGAALPESVLETLDHELL